MINTNGVTQTAEGAMLRIKVGGRHFTFNSSVFYKASTVRTYF